ncbi:unnamed protein product [Urochloa humidicola]
MPPLLSLSPSPFPCIPFRRLLLFRCFATSSATASSSLAPYHASFARRMALAGIYPHHRIAVGVSGGPDSMALCVLATAWKKAAGRKAADEEGFVSSAFVDGLLSVVVDHGLRPESADEARLVRDRVRGMGVECEITRCEWPDGRPKQGHVQEAAREVRYQKLLDICIKHQIGILLIAHHSDDQAELFVLRLSRNSGVLGLAGTASVSQLFAPYVKYDGENFRRYGILLVRPMLDFSKDDMYMICQGSNQAWVEDPTNNSMMYVRNRIRASLRNLSVEGTFLSGVHKLISTCRLTRTRVDYTWNMIAKQCVSMLEYGYAVIDLEKLDPLNVDDLCLSQYLAYILQFVSQRHRPLRGRSARLLLDYIRTIPCKAALTVAGCYLCAAPRSKVCNIRSVEENLSDPKASNGKMEMDNAPQHYRYLQRSAHKALQNLRSIPAAARRTLPVLTNAQGDIVCIPSIGFRCCPSLSIEAVFYPRVPLGGGYSSYL